MSCYTSVIHPVTGDELQFKTGYDSCDKYCVGDTVDFKIRTQFAGKAHLNDDAYYTESCSHDLREVTGRYFVIIKDHKVHEVVDAILDADGCPDVVRQRCWLCQKYGLEPLPIDSWSDEAWATKAKQDEESERRSARWRAETFGKTPDECLKLATGRYVRSKMYEDGIYRKIMGPSTTETVIPEATPKSNAYNETAALNAAFFKRLINDKEAGE